MIPQGYTLSIAGSFAIAVRRYRFSYDLNAWGFVAAALYAFVMLAVIAHGPLGASIGDLPMGLKAFINARRGGRGSSTGLTIRRFSGGGPELASSYCRSFSGWLRWLNGIPTE